MQYESFAPPTKGRAQVPAEENSGEFSKSLRAGGYGARSQLQSAAGLVGEALGFDEFAKNRRADAAELQTQVQANAPRIGSYKQVLDSPDFSTGLRNAGDYVTGLVGSSLPIMGAGLVGGLVGGVGGGAAAAGRAIAGAATATLPFNVGDVAQKQLADPEAMKASAGTRLRDAALGGAGASLIEGVVPGMVAGKILGQGAKQAAKQTLRQTVGGNLASIPVEGAAEAGGEAIKQYASNQDKALDTEALKEAFVGGAAAGTVFSGIGTVADVAHGNAAAVGNATRSATSFVGDQASKLVNRTKSTAETVQAEAPKKFKTVSEDIGELFQRGKDMSSSIVDKVLNGEALVDARQFATEAGQTFSDNEKVKAATEWTSKMANDAGLTPERRQQAVELAHTAGTEAGQVAAAAAKKTYDAGMTAAVKISNLYDSLADRVNKEVDLFRAGKAAQEEANGIKQSADFSGINKAIADQLGPLIDKNPGLADRPAAVAQLADNVRMAVSKIPNLDLNSDTAFRLIDMLGDQTVSTLDKAFDVVSKDAPATTRAAFYDKVMALADLQQRSQSLKDLIGNSLTDEAKQILHPSQYGELAQKLISHARGEYDKSVDGPSVGPSQRAARDYQFRQSMAEHFGDKADAISLAIEKEAKLRARAEAIPDAAGIRGEAEDLDGVDYANRSMGPAFNAETGERLEEGGVDSARFGLTKPDAAGKSKSKMDGLAMLENSQYARQHMLDLQEEYKSPEGEEPKYTIKFEKIPGSDKGYIVVERNGAASEGEFGIGDLERIKLETHEFSKSPSRINVGNLKIDAVKIAQLAGKRDGFKFESPDTLPSIHRTVDMFKRGIAQLSIQFDKNIDVPDSTVIGYSGKRVDTPDGPRYVRAPVTWGDAQKIRRATADDRAADANAQQLTRLREQYLRATAGPEKLAKLGLTEDKLSPKDMEGLIEAAKKLNKDAEYIKSRELAGDDYVGSTSDAPRTLGQGRSLGGAEPLQPRQGPRFPDGVGGESTTSTPRARAMKRLEANHERHLDNIENKGVPRDKIKTKTDMGEFPFEQRDERFDKYGDLTRESAVDLLQGDYDGGIDVNNRSTYERDRVNNQDSRGEGRTAIGKDENITRVAATMSEKDMVNKSNMDGSPQHVSSKKSGINLKPIINIANELKAGEFTSAGSIQIGKRLSILIQNRGLMRESDVAKLQTITTVMTASQVGNIVNPLVEKYETIIVSNKSAKKSTAGSPLTEPTISADGGKPLPKPVAAKTAAAFSGDKQSVERMQQEFPELELRRPTLSERAQISSIIAGIDQVSGADMPKLIGVSIRDGDKSGFAAKAVTRDGGHHIILSKELFDETTPMLGSTADKVERAMAHEIGHLRDRDLDNFSDNSDRFYRDGDLHNEIEDFASRNPVASNWYDYALQTTKNPQRELFAQAFALFHHNPEVLRENQPLAHEFFQTFGEGQRSEGRPVAAGRTDLAARSVADKKTALLEAAKANDPALLKELSESSDAKSLQRAVAELPPGAAADTANTRMAELVQDPSVAYDLTKKYSMDGSRIHDESGNEGFGATHDSPVRHEGVFDWRSHQGKGEGNASFGAGTYLSTAEGVHKSYKKQFTASVAGEFEGVKMRALEGKIERAKQELSFLPNRVGPVAVSVRARIATLQQALDAIPKSPTYEVSVNIKPEQLLDWDAPLSEQSDTIKNALLLGQNQSAEQRATLRKIERFMGAQKKAGAFAHTGGEFYKYVARELGSQAAASDYLQSLGILGHKYAASGGKNDAHPNYVIYDDSKITTNYVHFDKSESGNSKTDSAAARTAITDYITKVLGSSVKLQFKDLSHAGEFERMRLNDIIRLSTTALDPMSTAHHEALHGFFAQLRDAKATDIMGVLDKAASSENVIRQLNELYKNNGPVLAQLKDPEERVAYMYQHWAAGNLTIGFQPRSIMARVAGFIRGVLGIWSNDQRALAILSHFNSGEYAASGRDVGATQQKYIQGGRNQALEAAKAFTAPLARFADAVVSTGSGRLRDTGIPSIIRLADIIKREATDGKGGDQGFIAAARIEATKRNSALAEALKDFNQDELHEAMEALQRGRGYNGVNATRIREAQTIIKATLADTRGYMLAAGVDIGNLGPDYFPRIWDSHYISKNQQAFKDMLEPYIRRGEHKGSADDLIRHLAAHEGSEFGVERKKLNFDEVKARPPGMQFKKTRLLSYITPEDAAMFVNKDLLGTLTTYIHQAARKAEWSRRLGNGKLEALVEKAKEEGATPEQLKMTDTYLQGIDGTLGDSINPHARRIMGNMIVYQNIRLLPFAVFSSIIDPMGVMVRGGTMKDAFATFKRGIMEIPKGLGKQSADDQATQLAELVGVLDSAVLASTLGDVYTQGMVGGFAKKANTLFFKFNLMEGLNRSFRIGASEAAIKFIARHADGKDSKHSQRWINELGLEAGDIVPTADGRIALTTSEGLSIEQQRRVHAAINQWVDGAVLRPDAADKPIWFNDPHWALVSHLKQFVYSFQKTILERTVHEYKQGNYTPAMALAGYVPLMMAADLVKGMIQGGGEQPEWKKGWTMVDYTTYAVQRAGVFGVSQFGLDMAKDVREGGIGIGALVGPTIEQFTDVVGLLGGHKQFGPMVLNAMPANALYKNAFNNEAPDSPGITK